MAYRIKSVQLDHEVDFRPLGGRTTSFIEVDEKRISVASAGVSIAMEGGFLVFSKEGVPDRIRVSTLLAKRIHEVWTDEPAPVKK